MCGHCGCHDVDAIRELREEHVALSDEADAVRRALRADDQETAVSLMAELVGHLRRHVRREELGVFTALRERGEFGEEVAALEGEHLELDATIAALDPQGEEFGASVLALLADLDQHIEREDLGVFPVSVVTLGAAGWATVEHAHAEHPTFLKEGALR